MSENVNEPIGPGARARGCPPPDQLHALEGDALPDALRAQTEAHLAACPACRALAADLALLEPELPASLLEARRRDRITPVVWLAAAAAVLAAAGLGLWWQATSSTLSSTVVAKPAPVAVSAAATPTPGLWTVEPPALVVPAEAAVVMRGTANPTLSSLMDALAPYRAGNFPEAARRLDAFSHAHPKVADAWFSLGASRLLGGDPKAARTALAEFARLEPAARRDETAWLDATAAARANATSDAKQTLSALCAEPGAFKARACDALNTLH